MSSEFQVNTYTDSHEQYPAVTALSNGNFVVTWRSSYQDGLGYGVYGRILGQPIAKDFTITQEGIINFAPYVSDYENSDSLLKVVFTSLTSPDAITSYGAAVVIGNEYISTNLNFSCTSSGSSIDTFEYKLVDTDGLESNIQTITKDFNCPPESFA